MSVIDNDDEVLDKNIKDLKSVYAEEVFNNMARVFKKMIANPDPPSKNPNEPKPMNDNSNLANYFCTE